jgi:hypothetical protein
MDVQIGAGSVVSVEFSSLIPENNAEDLVFKSEAIVASSCAEFATPALSTVT